MSCPFSGSRLVAGVDDGGGSGRGGGSRGVVRSGGGWERGSSIETLSMGSPVRNLGTVQDRVNSYTRMTRSPSEPVVVKRKISGGGWTKKSNASDSGVGSSGNANDGDVSSSSSVGVRFRPHKEEYGDESVPLLTPPRDPPDANQPLSIQNLTEAVWCFITIPVSIS